MLRPIRPILTTALALLLSFVLATGAAASSRPNAYVLPGDAVFPEGVVIDDHAGRFFVSSTTDGSIFRGDLDERRARIWLPGGADGRTTAIGLELDRSGRLLIAGGGTGRVWAYDTSDRDLVGIFDTGATSGTFINDVASTPSRDAYATDSLRPILFRISREALASADGNVVAAELWLDLTGTPIQYTAGFNLNGIVSSADGRHLVTVQSNTGQLFRISTSNKAVREIDLGGATVPAGDGLVLRGRTLWVVQNSLEQITKIRLSNNLSSGRVVETFTDPSFAFPTTADIHGNTMLVVNSQFDRRGPGLTPDLPFKVSAIRVP